MKVLCIDDSGKTNLKIGNTYEVIDEGVCNCICKIQVYYLKGLNEVTSKKCLGCGKLTLQAPEHYKKSRFIPIDDLEAIEEEEYLVKVEVKQAETV